MPTQTISRCGGTTTGSYSSLVLAIGTPGTLRAYWRLGETSSTFADTSGYEPATPQDLTISGTGSNTRGVLGVVSPSNDDGAWQLNVKGNPSPGDVGATPGGGGNPYPGTQSSFTIVAWVRTTATVGGDPAWRGSVYANATLIAGSPSFERGWSLDINYPGGAANPSARLTRSNDVANGGQVYAEIAGLIPGTDYMIAGTFDGTQIQLYANGVLGATQADTLRNIPQANGVSIGRGVGGQYYGVVDEVSLWAQVLTGANLLALYGQGTL